MMSNSELLTMRALGEHLMWVAPVGVRELRGWMVCRRVMNNPDGPNTRVDYLRVNPREGQSEWKKPFRECEHLFPTLDAAWGAVTGVGVSQPNPWGGDSMFRPAGSFEEVRQRFAPVQQAMHGWAKLEDVIVLLYNQMNANFKRILDLESYAPKKVITSDGTVMVWRCPVELIPVTHDARGPGAQESAESTDRSVYRTAGGTQA